MQLGNHRQMDERPERTGLPHPDNLRSFPESGARSLRNAAYSGALEQEQIGRTQSRQGRAAQVAGKGDGIGGTGVNSLAVIPDQSTIEAHADPGQFVVLCLERAKTWLTEALEHRDIEKIVEVKTQAEALRMYTAQKQIGKDAELAATEIVRRAERGIGLSIRKGQESGTILKSGQHIGNQHSNGRTSNKASSTLPPSPAQFVDAHELSSNGGGIYAMTDGVTENQFEAALQKAKEEKNLSRANVVRKVRGIESASLTKAQRIERIREMANQAYRASQIAPEINISEEHVRLLARQAGIKLPDDIIGGTKKINPNRIVRETVAGAQNLVAGLELLNGNIAKLDQAELPEWISSLSDSLQQLNSLLRKLKEVKTQ